MTIMGGSKHTAMNLRVGGEGVHVRSCDEGPSIQPCTCTWGGKSVHVRTYDGGLSTQL